MSSLKDILRSRFIKDVLQDVIPKNGTKWKVLIVDSVAHRALTSVCSQNDVLGQNVTIVEQLANRREPYPQYEAIYLLSPQPESVDMLIADYRGKAPYAAAHLFFISGLPDSLLHKMQRSEALMSKVRNLKELRADFIATENQTFSVDLPFSFSAAMNAPTQSLLNYELEPVAQRLVSVLATLGEYPYIRYYNPSNAAVATSTQEKLAGKLAAMVQTELDSYCQKDKNFPPPSPHPRAILLVLDRGVDALAPLLHEFTYQALIHDLFQLEDGNKYRHEDASNGLAVLDESDPFFLSQRYSHIADVLDFLATSVKQFKQENKAAQYQQNQDGASSLDQISKMKDALSAMPQFQEMKSKFSIHTSICESFQKIYEAYNLKDLSGIEQDLATGETSEGKPAKMIGVDVQSLLSDNRICHSDKVRLLMLYIIAQDGLPDNERQKLFDAARLTLEESQAVTNLSTLGIRLSASLEKRRTEAKNPYSLQNLRATRRRPEAKFDTSRYVPVLKYMLEDQAKNVLDESVFTWIKEPPRAVVSSSPSVTRTNAPTSYNYVADASGMGAGAQRTKPSWASRKPVASAGVSEAVNGRLSTSSSSSTLNSVAGAVALPSSDELRRNGPRIIIFMMGGVTFSEIRSCNEILREFSREIFIGSTHHLNPHSFVDLLKTLHRTGPAQPSRHPYIVPAPNQSPPGSRGSSAQGSPRHPRYRDERGQQPGTPPSRDERYSRPDDYDRNAQRGERQSSSRSQHHRGSSDDRRGYPQDDRDQYDPRYQQAPLSRHDSRGEVRGQSYRPDSGGRSSDPRRDDRRDDRRDNRREDRREPPRDDRRDDRREPPRDDRRSPYNSREDVRVNMERMAISDRQGSREGMSSSRQGSREDVSSSSSSTPASASSRPPEKEKKSWFKRNK
ncbi:vacuolar sorting protein VPS33/slp1 [Phlyctochytrium planicorne]|nr:vacuolar sorting protein VPS33/slp1 [Phlyctochytrium planicorne]